MSNASLEISFAPLSADHHATTVILAANDLALGTSASSLNTKTGGAVLKAAEAADFKGKAKSSIELLALPKIEGLIRDARDGALYKSEFGSRMKGQGAYAEHLRTTFEVFTKKLGFGRLPELDCGQFRPPRDAGGQQRLF